MMSKFGLFSYRRISKFTAVPPEKYTARHSMLKMRLGALPEVEVKTPHTPPGLPEQPACASVRRSSHNPKIALLWGASGRQALVNGEMALVNCSEPFDDTVALVVAALL